MRSLIAFFTMAALFGVAGCGGSQKEESHQSKQSAANDSEPAALPTVDPPLTRRDLILAAMEASTALVTAADDAERQQQLNGRSFSFRIRLCEGAPSRDRLTFDRARRVLRVAVSPDLGANDPVAVALGAGKYEAVEGFWVPYPWLLQAACPPAPSSGKAENPGAAPPIAPAQARPTLALAEFFLLDADRSARREGRPFSVTRRLDEGVTPGPVDLVLQGRLARLPGARVINCVASPAMLAPECIVSVRFDAVRLEQANTGELLGEWSRA